MLDKNKQIWFIGIKGTGMASLALVLHDLGYNVAGSDIEKYTFTQVPLEKAGIEVKNFDPKNIKSNAEQVIVKGNAFKQDNPEVAACLDKNVEWQSYPDTVEEIVQMHTSIGVSGTHGKTSTTSLLSHVLGEVAPTSYLIGDGRGKGVEDSRFFVYEADEYRRHFLAYHPDYQIMTNIDFDHPDYFKDQDDYTSAFQTAADQTKKALFVWGDDKRLQSLKTDIPKYTYGFKDTDDFQAVNIEKTTTGSKFNVLAHGKDLGRFEIHLFGDHSILNTTAVIAVAYTEKVPMDDIKEGLLTFKGAKRRFAEKDFGDVSVIDDYAHHPTEIKAMLKAAKNYPHKELYVAFQPHTYTRTRTLFEDFSKAFDGVDHLILADIYAAREKDTGVVSSLMLGDAIRSRGIDAINYDNFDDMLAYLNENAKPCDLIITVGAGDIYTLGEMYLKK